MPEIGRPVDPQAQQYRQVTMAPKALSNRTGGGARELDEQIINRATGRNQKAFIKTVPIMKWVKMSFLNSSLTNYKTKIR